ncbi:hypothetical protein CHS0354_034467, partial [Potamilus streckersoni]
MKENHTSSYLLEFQLEQFSPRPVYEFTITLGHVLQQPMMKSAHIHWGTFSNNPVMNSPYTLGQDLHGAISPTTPVMNSTHIHWASSPMGQFPKNRVMNSPLKLGQVLQK